MIGQTTSMTDSEEDGGRADDVFRRAAFNWAQSTKRLVESSTAIGMNTRVAYSALADIRHAKEMLDSLFIPRAAKVPANFADQASDITAADVKSTVVSLARRVATAPLNEVRKTPFNSRVESRVESPCPPSHQSIGCLPPVDGWDGKSIVEDVPAVVVDEPQLDPVEEFVPPPLDLGTLGSWSEPPPVEIDHAGQVPMTSAPEPRPVRRESKPLSRSPKKHSGADLSAPVHPKGGKMLWAGIDCPTCTAVATERCKKSDDAPMEKPHNERKTMADAMQSVVSLAESFARSEENNPA